MYTAWLYPGAVLGLYAMSATTACCVYSSPSSSQANFKVPAPTVSESVDAMLKSMKAICLHISALFINYDVITSLEPII